MFESKIARRNLLAGVVFTICTLFSASPLFALGTYAEGRAVIKLTKFESSGIIFESYEGTATVTTFDAKENCNSDENECYTPTTESISISVRPESKAAVNFMLKNLGKQMLIHYCIHRIEPIALKTDFEILNAQPVSAGRPADLADRHTVKKSGARRNFSVRGKILRLEERGTAVKTYEGLYKDLQRGKVHPFSITEESMAAFAFRVMQTGQPHYLGITQAYVTGFRESDFDVFEINRKDPAGGLVDEVSNPDDE
ncbi:MAG: hypothetical protein NXI24_07870 [bacterium]|nr:hypothetical protein [bacterium]